MSSQTIKLNSPDLLVRSVERKMVGQKTDDWVG